MKHVRTGAAATACRALPLSPHTRAGHRGCRTDGALHRSGRLGVPGRRVPAATDAALVLAEDVPELLLHDAVEGGRGPAATAAVAIDIPGASDGARDLGAGQLGDGHAHVIERPQPK